MDVDGGVTVGIGGLAIAADKTVRMTASEWRQPGRLLSPLLFQ
jgi:hypothetical protein